MRLKASSLDCVLPLVLLEVVIVAVGTPFRTRIPPALLVALLPVGLIEINRWEEFLTSGSAVALYVEFLGFF